MAVIREVQRMLDRARKAFAGDAPSNRREADRIPVHAVTIVTAGGKRQQAEMRDVSPDGARIVSPHRLPPGTQLAIELPDLPAPVAGRVVHAEGAEVGLQFDTPGSVLVIAGWAAGRPSCAPESAGSDQDDDPRAARAGG